MRSEKGKGKWRIDLGEQMEDNLLDTTPPIFSSSISLFKNQVVNSDKILLYVHLYEIKLTHIILNI